MKNYETNRYNALKRVQKFNTDNDTPLSTIPDYSDEETDLDQTILLLESAMGIQSVDNKGIANSKSSLKEIMAKAVIKLVLRANVKATRVGNKELAKDLDHPITYFSKPNDETALLRCSSAIKLISDNPSVFTNITAQEITDAQKTITDFTNIKNDPTSSIETKKAQGTDQIDPLLDDADVYVQNMSKLIHSYFPDSAMADEFDLQSQIINSGVRHNIVTFHITDADTQQPIDKSKALCNKNNKEAQTNGTDPAVIEGVPTGKQPFAVSADGYTTQNITVKVIRSTNTEVNVQLRKAV